MTSVDADHAMRVIRARCGDMLASDLARVEAALKGGDDATVSGEVVLKRIGDVLDALDARIAAFGERLVTLEEAAA
jgi:hypothetical protein